MRVRPRETTELTTLLDACVEVEQRLRTLRAVWANNPNFPSKELPEETRVFWDAELSQLLEKLEVVAEGIRGRRSRTPTTVTRHDP